MKKIEPKKSLIKSGAALCLLLFVSGCAANPFAKRTYIDAAMQRMEEGDYEGALTSFSEGLAAGESKREVYRGRGITYYKMGDFEQALASFDTALKETNGIVDALDYDVNYYLASCYMETKRYALAESTYSILLDLKKKDADAYYLRGVARLKSGNVRAATEDMEKAYTLRPTDYDRIFLMYEAYEEAGFVAEGRAFLEKAYASSTEGLSDYERGRFAYYRGDMTEAMKYLESARSAATSQTIDAVLLLGKVAEDTGDYDYAEGIYRAYLKNNRENARVYNQLGLCEMRSGRLDAAISDFESGISLDDASMRQDLAWNMIVAYEYKGEFGTARDLTRSYLERYPTDEKAIREYTFLSTR